MPQWLQLVLAIAPSVLGVIPGIPPALVIAITHAIVAVEAVPGLDGAAKRAKVLGVASEVIERVMSVQPAAVSDSQALLRQVGTGVDATISTVKTVQVLASAAAIQAHA